MLQANDQRFFLLQPFSIVLARRPAHDDVQAEYDNLPVNTS
jgi:hypothetical protein